MLFTVTDFLDTDYVSLLLDGPDGRPDLPDLQRIVVLRGSEHDETTAFAAFVAATALWIDGERTLPGMALRLKLARTSLTGLSQNPVLVTLTPAVDWAGVDVNRRKDIEIRLSRIAGTAQTVDAQTRAIGEAAR